MGNIYIYVRAMTMRRWRALERGGGVGFRPITLHDDLPLYLPISFRLISLAVSLSLALSLSRYISAFKKNILTTSAVSSNNLGAESFYGSPPQHFFNETAGFETSSRRYLLKYGVPCHPDVMVRLCFSNKKMYEDASKNSTLLCVEQP